MLPLCLGVASGLVSCTSLTPTAIDVDDCTPSRYEYASIHMGSRCSIVLYATSESHAAAIAQAAFDEIAKVEDALSDYRPSSESMRATSQPSGTWVQVSHLLIDVLHKSMEFFQLSDGAFDPTVGRFTHLWRQAKKESRIPYPIELDEAAHAVGFSFIELDSTNDRVRFMREGMILDFGAIGKGYAADKALEVIRMNGITMALVDVGGDIALGDPPMTDTNGWSVSVQAGTGAEWTAPLHSCAIATSGDLERHYEHEGVRYSHILDPRTGIGVSHRRAVTVIAHDGTTADSVASIVSVLGESIIPKLEDQFPGIQILIESGSQY